MHSSTPFQYLPPHVVHLIVNHVVGHNCSYDNEEKVALEDRQVFLIPLLWVCRNFRDNISSRFFHECVLDLGFGYYGDIKLRTTWKSSPREPVSPMYHLAKFLKIHLEVWRVYSGDTVRMLSASPFDGVAFPHVSKLSVGLHYSHKRREGKGIVDGFPRDSTRNIGDFVRRIKHIAPEISEVSISVYNEPTERDNAAELHFGDLYSRLFSMTKTTVLADFYSKAGRYVNLDLIRDLVHLTSHLGAQADQMLLLAQRNAQTLQHLELDFNRFTDITGLIQEPDSGEYVEYPCLHTLRLESIGKYLSSNTMTKAGAIPFPCLRRLHANLNYPFGDDVLFRGNAATLECLKLALDQATVNILQRYAVFKPASHLRLQRVAIDQIGQRPIIDFAKAGSYLEFVMSIAPGAAVRHIYDVCLGEEGFAPVLAVLGNYTCIQVLSLRYIHVSLWDVIALIKSLPLLSDLKTGVPMLGEPIQGVSATDLPEYVHSTHAPLGKRFRSWIFSCRCTSELAEMSMVMLLLAQACPSFYRAAVEDYEGNRRFREAMCDMIAEPEFCQYAARVLRLLPSEYTGE